MKKLLFGIISLSIILMPALAAAQAPLVPCSGPDCTITKFFEMLNRIFNFAVKFIAAPLAFLMLVIGGTMILVSAGNPNIVANGKKVLWAAIIGLVLVFCAWLIVNEIMVALGVVNWNTI